MPLAFVARAGDLQDNQSNGVLGLAGRRSTSGHGLLAVKKHGQLADNTRSTSGQFVINANLY